MVIGVDVGTTAVKAVLLDERGVVRRASEQAHPLISQQPGYAEEDPEAWWSGVLRALRALTEGLDPAQVEALGVSGMVPALILQRGGRPLRPSIQQNDARAVEEWIELRSQFGDDWLFQRAATVWNTQILAPKLLWLKRHEPEAWEQADWISGSYEHITHRLTGARYSEVNWALESGLFNPYRESWIEELADYLDLDLEKLGPLRRPLDWVGMLRAEVARLTGLPQELPVIAGSADHIAAALAAGLKEPGEVVLKLGGAGDVLYVTHQLTPIRELYIDYHDLPDRFVINGCMATSGSLLRWFRDHFRPQASFALLDQEAEDVPPGAEGLVALPYFLGEKTPIHDPQARGILVGLTLSHTPSHIYRALLESVAYAFRHHLELLEERDQTISTVLVMDGGARSSLWRRILASALGRPVAYVRGGERGSAYGVALLAGVTAGSLTFDDLKREVVELTEPEEAWRPVYEALYPIYRSTYLRLKDLFPRLRSAYA